MKRHYFGLMGLLAMVLMVACNKKDDAPFDPVKQAALDEQLILKYIADKGITDVMKDDTSGLRYKIIEHANTTKDTIELNERMNLNYEGKLLNGSVFETRQNNTLSDLRLQDLISGWKIGLRKIAEGDSVMLIIPSGLGYGNSGNQAIPANSVLVFNIRLNDFYF